MPADAPGLPAARGPADGAAVVGSARVRRAALGVEAREALRLAVEPVDELVAPARKGRRRQSDSSGEWVRASRRAPPLIGEVGGHVELIGGRRGRRRRGRRRRGRHHWKRRRRPRRRARLEASVVRRIPAVLVPVMARLPRWRPRWRRRRVAAYNPSWRGLYLSLCMSFRAVSGLLSMEDRSHSTGSHAATVEQLQVCRRSTHFSRRLQRRRCGCVRRCGAAQETAEHVSSSRVKIHGLRRPDAARGS